jgi:hypothetical protein
LDDGLESAQPVQPGEDRLTRCVHPGPDVLQRRGRLGDLLAPEFLGNELFFDLKGKAQLERTWFVSVAHPDVRGVSAGSEDLAVAPMIDGSWRVWVR